MPFPISSLLEGRALPTTIDSIETAEKALGLMTEHDFSQLPVVEEKRLTGLVTAESILRAIRTFKVPLEKLTVRDCKVKVSEYAQDAELFDVLIGLETQSVAVIVDPQKSVTGIVTDYDTAVYFRQRAENAMLVEDIEMTLRDFIKLAFDQNNQDSNTGDFEQAVAKACAPDREREAFRNAIGAYLANTNVKTPPDESAVEKAFAVLSKAEKSQKKFEDLSLKEYSKMWLSSDRWHQYKTAINLEVAAIQRMLDQVIEVRNIISHFKREVTRSEYLFLLQCRDWLQAHKGALLDLAGQTTAKIESEIKSVAKAVENSSAAEEAGNPGHTNNEDPSEQLASPEPETELDIASVERSSSLKRWLSGVPNHIYTTWIDFLKFEELIGTRLPSAALKHRSWWANDLTTHSPSRLWLLYGWETDIVDMERERVRFRRIDE